MLNLEQVHMISPRCLSLKMRLSLSPVSGISGARYDTLLIHCLVFSTTKQLSAPSGAL